MRNETVISICTQAYNAKAFLPRCIESILAQTYHNFEYILIDNGSTDGSRELMVQYAAQDSRIKLIRFESNIVNPWRWISKERSSGKYIAMLDSDDWLEPTFLERMVSLAERQRLDIVCTGSALHVEGREDMVSGVRSLPRQIVLENSEYASYFPYYHVFFRTTWGKLIRREVFLSADLSIIDREEITNGSDTLSAFAWLRQAKRICVDNSVLHHYLMRRKSVSHIYLPNRFKSNTVLHQDAINFLSQYGPVSQSNLHFLHIVYANAVYDTLEALFSSDLSQEDKLAEYCAIAVHPTTQEAFQDNDEAIRRSRDTLLTQLLTVTAAVEGENCALMDAVDVLCPRCGKALDSKVLPLAQREPALLGALQEDEPDQLALCLLDMITAQKYTKQYDLSGILRKLAEDKPLLRTIDQIPFLRKYRTIYWLIWQGENLVALDEMTGMLLASQVRGAGESFLQLYLTLAAMLEQTSAFIFGKIQLAKFYLRQNRAGDCQAVLDELTEMGVALNDEISALHRALKSAKERR